MLEASESLHNVGVFACRNDGGRSWCKAKDTESDDCQLKASARITSRDVPVHEVANQT
jgi:hypothetical protein